MVVTRSTRTIAQIFGLIILTVVLSIIAYYVGSSLGKSLIVGTQITHSEWQAYYMKLVAIVGATGGVLSLVWYMLARFGMKIDSPFGVGKRGLWVILGLLTLVECVAIPYVYSTMNSTLKMGISIPAVFVILYVVIGYWGGSVFATPDVYKYTPLGAEMIRASNGRK